MTPGGIYIAYLPKMYSLIDQEIHIYTIVFSIIFIIFSIILSKVHHWYRYL